MSLEKLLKTEQAMELAKVQAQAPVGFRAGEEWIGDHGTITTRGALDRNTAHDALLKESGYEPEDFMVVGDVRHSSWDAQVKGEGVQRLTSHRFNVKKRSSSDADIQELIDLVGRRQTAPSSGLGAGTFHFANGDWQLGKADGDGTKGTVDRILKSIEGGKQAFIKSRRHDTAFVHLSFLGDCMEGFVSQGGKNAWRTELTLTEQLRLMRRLMLHAIDEFAPLTDRLTVVSIPGNHDEAVRSPGITTYDDSFAVDSLVAVTDAMRMNGNVYGHVETFVPQRDSLTVTLDVNGTIITHAHGHQWRTAKHWDWWKGQAFEPGADIGQASILLAAHGHHFQIDTKGQRTYVMTPAQEQESTWWKNQTGDHGAPGALIFTTENGIGKGYTIV